MDFVASKRTAVYYEGISLAPKENKKP